MSKTKQKKTDSNLLISSNTNLTVQWIKIPTNNQHVPHDQTKIHKNYNNETRC